PDSSASVGSPSLLQPLGARTRYRAGRQTSCGPSASEDSMTEFRRLKMKIGEAEFEADVPENKVQPMYAQFLFMLERRNRSVVRPLDVDAGVSSKPEMTVQVAPAESFGETVDEALLSRVFDLQEDGAVTLRVLPNGPDQSADVLLLLLYGYHRIKHEECVLATELFRAAERSGISLRRPAKELVRNSRFVIRGGQ